MPDTTQGASAPDSTDHTPLIDPLAKLDTALMALRRARESSPDDNLRLAYGCILQAREALAYQQESDLRQAVADIERESEACSSQIKTIATLTLYAMERPDFYGISFTQHVGDAFEAISTLSEHIREFVHSRAADVGVNGVRREWYRHFDAKCTADNLQVARHASAALAR